MPPQRPPALRPHTLRRQPRVAGQRHPTDRPARPAEHDESHGAIALDDRAACVAEVGPPSRRWSPRVLSAPRVGLIAVVVIALGLAVWFRVEVTVLSDSAATSNRALLDVGTTAQLSGQVRDGVERVFSYDFARLDDNERAAAAVITGPFARDYRQQFARVRELAPAQQAVVVATVPALAVSVLDGDRAVVVVFVDQQANRAGQAAPLVAAGRLQVSAQRVNSSWKLAGVEPF